MAIRSEAPHRSMGVFLENKEYVLGALSRGLHTQTPFRTCISGDMQIAALSNPLYWICAPGLNRLGCFIFLAPNLGPSKFGKALK
jgi:hypothetical protein